MLSKFEQARLWACGRGDVSTPSFDCHLNPIPTGGGQIMPTIYCCPHQVLKATGAPVNESIGTALNAAPWLDWRKGKKLSQSMTSLSYK